MTETESPQTGTVILFRTFKRRLLLLFFALVVPWPVLYGILWQIQGPMLLVYEGPAVVLVFLIFKWSDLELRASPQGLVLRSRRLLWSGSTRYLPRYGAQYVAVEEIAAEQSYALLLWSIPTDDRLTPAAQAVAAADPEYAGPVAAKLLLRMHSFDAVFAIALRLCAYWDLSLESDSIDAETIAWPDLKEFPETEQMPRITEVHTERGRCFKLPSPTLNPQVIPTLWLCAGGALAATWYWGPRVVAGISAVVKLPGGAFSPGSFGVYLHESQCAEIFLLLVFGAATYYFLQAWYWISLKQRVTLLRGDQVEIETQQLFRRRKVAQLSRAEITEMTLVPEPQTAAVMAPEQSYLLVSYRHTPPLEFGLGLTREELAGLFDRLYPPKN